MKLNDATDIMKKVGIKGKSGQIIQRPAQDVSGAPLDKRTITTDVHIKGTALFVSIAQGSAIDPVSLEKLKEQAPTAAKTVEVAAAKSPTAKRRTTKKPPDTSPADSEQAGS